MCAPVGSSQLLKPWNQIDATTLRSCPIALFMRYFLFITATTENPALERYGSIRRNVAWSSVETVNHLELIQCQLSLCFPWKCKISSGTPVSLRWPLGASVGSLGTTVWIQRLLTSAARIASGQKTKWTSTGLSQLNEQRIPPPYLEQCFLTSLRIRNIWEPYCNEHSWALPQGNWPGEFQVPV